MSRLLLVRTQDQTHPHQLCAVVNDFLSRWRSMTVEAIRQESTTLPEFMDVVSPDVRSRMMSGIRGKHTVPEMIVRSIAHRLGLRFRLHGNLPGRPDLVFPKHRSVILGHGCFWHRHDCGLAAIPSTRTDFWLAKFAANQERDRRNRTLLMDEGWRVLEIWECQTRDHETVRRRLVRFFGLQPPVAGPSRPRRQRAAD